ncbi:MAG TPA: cysteine--tRNA ligase [Bosea sp. (in: a-proteobacteria)]|jgi:cysteinyl-tRNA synthetase|uniref:cysteine--tRNA ligase n=1 Tax=Bosea sp. (in: a-proteobacteria) TaxID=1871050 RepID=UPI002DDD065F|nr:cysteine--tRNA ligase [Bosea sp. (in: a-proteobacteria)]HEV2553279.1 cysteine--tRNA ligase [Bosea sp. (in: a-proteobacteria)]
MPTLRLYNTLTRTKEDFVPVDPDNVRMYVCGPTVYDYAHIGNARPVIVFDVLYRLLRHLYGADHVTYARNLTDVDDKINARAARDFPGLPLNEAIAKVTEATTAQFHADIAALGCLPPDEEPRATDHIGEMQAIIHRLIARGVAYVAEEHVLFHVPAVAHLRAAPKYGALARRPLDEMIAGARVDVAPYKRDPMDFVLWKPSRDGIDPGWLWPNGAPEGITRPGRPGWHIECSAMSMAKLLEPFGGGLSCDDPEKNVFDIHGGGIDLVFPHHENEIAQSCCAFGGADGSGRMANYWMHNGFLQVEGEKMSKSLGNFVTINELLETETFGGRKWPGEVLRLAMLKTHYRQPIDWTVKALEEAEKTLDGWYELLETTPINEAAEPVRSVVEPLLDDLNTVAAVHELYPLFNSSRSGAMRMGGLMGWDIRNPESASAVVAAARVLGLMQHSPVEWRAQKIANACVDETLVRSLIDNRLDARRAKNFAESDRIRDELAAMGIALKDGKDPASGEPTTSWEVKR